MFDPFDKRDDRPVNAGGGLRSGVVFAWNGKYISAGL
jgi:hypothetical protein